MNHRLKVIFLLLSSLIFLPSFAFAAENIPHITGSSLAIYWAIPFAGILLSIALFPLLAPNLWHHHYGKISLSWALILIVPFILTYGVNAVIYEIMHSLLLEYIPFITLLFALFTISGGIHIRGSLSGSPKVNLIILLIGTILASIMGTTGAAMLLIRPLIRANHKRKYKVHTIVFFIFMVANIGGSLSPIGDPPLFLGFLKGVDFFWITKHMWHLMLFMIGSLSVIYFIMDSILFAKEGKPSGLDENEDKIDFGITGKLNFIFLIGVIGAVIMSGVWQPITEISLYHVQLGLQDIFRDGILIILAILSIIFTQKKVRLSNNYSWEPIIEVAKLFLGIFICMIPAIAILKAGDQGALKSVVNLVTHNGEPVNSMYFWLTGILSSFLDNAPTYLVFFNTAGGNAHYLMNHVETLLAISAGAVFMGANTYIGNAPNFMVKAIAESRNIKMPSFFGYMLYSITILIPLFIIGDLLFIA